MNEITKEIFEFLNVEPEQVFRIEYSKNYYKINEWLQVFFCDSIKNVNKNLWTLCGPHITIAHFITKQKKIKKIIMPTEKEQLAINYARACGCNWLAKDKNGEVYAYPTKPQKSDIMWFREDTSFEIVEICIPISFLSWEDKTPYYIGDEK